MDFRSEENKGRNALLLKKNLRRTSHSAKVTERRFIRLLIEHRENLEVPFEFDELKAAVWSWGKNKALGPNGFALEFFQRFWDKTGKYVYEAVQFFEKHPLINPGSNTSFVTLIPKVNNPLTLFYY